MKDEIVLTPEGRDLINKYKQEAFEALADIETAEEALKAVVEAALDGIGLPKGIVSKYYKVKFEEKLAELAAQASVFEYLSEGE